MDFKLLLVLLSLGLFSCATSTGFNRDSLKAELGVKHSSTIESMAAEKPTASAPFRLGIYFVPSKSQDWSWHEEDKQRLVEFFKGEAYENLITEVKVIKYGASALIDIQNQVAKEVDTLLVISGVASVDSYINDYAYSYFLILPLLFVPGNERDVLFMAKAQLFDVHNAFEYMKASSENVLHETYIPLNGGRTIDVIDKSKASALTVLEAQIAKTIFKIPLKK